MFGVASAFSDLFTALFSMSVSHIAEYFYCVCFFVFISLAAKAQYSQAGTTLHTYPPTIYMQSPNYTPPFNLLLPRFTFIRNERPANTKESCSLETRDHIENTYKPLCFEFSLSSNDHAPPFSVVLLVYLSQRIYSIHRSWEYQRNRTQCTVSSTKDCKHHKLRKIHNKTDPRSNYDTNRHISPSDDHANRRKRIVTT